jgi:hypothetical protein
MTVTDPKTDLHSYLQEARDALLWKLEGLSEYEIRRPLVPTGTNLLGLVKHMTAIELAYFGDTFGRPYPSAPPQDESDANADMFARPDESREFITGQYRQAWAYANATISELPLDAIGHVPWWGAPRNEVSLHQILVRMTTETSRHAGHADIIRELIDGAAGMAAHNPNLPADDAGWWSRYRDRVEQAAREAADPAGG